MIIDKYHYTNETDYLSKHSKLKIKTLHYYFFSSPLPLGHSWGPAFFTGAQAPVGPGLAPPLTIRFITSRIETVQLHNPAVVNVKF